MRDKAQIRLVTTAMRDFTRPFVVPIAYEPDETVVRLAGTGNVIQTLGRRLLLTCEHVVLGKPRLAFRPWGTENFLLAPLNFASASYPYDTAIGRIDHENWAAIAHQAEPVPYDHFSLTHHPTDENELFFFKGYAGENAAFGFDILATDATSYTTQAISDASEHIADRYFFLLNHKPEDTECVDDVSSTRFENPEGFSGSLVWDTGYVDCLRRAEPWTPARARVTGMVCRWLTGDPGIKVLRVEQLRSYLLTGIEEMRANGDW
jgi:hypothetical protein